MKEQPKNASQTFAELCAPFEGPYFDRVISGIAVAFAFIVRADGAVSPAEVERFSELLTRARLLSDSATRARFEAGFRALAAELVRDRAEARDWVVARLAEFAGDPLRVELIQSAAQAAALADANLARAETAALCDVERALGVRARRN